jgi:TRAP-type C4-dicarboxylate transport system substrate-binding protein
MYPAESLSKSKDNIDSVVGGVADMAWLNMGNWTGRFLLSEVVTLPFFNLLSGKINGKTVSAGVVNSHIIQELYDTFPEIQAEYSSMKLLFIHTSDPYFIASTKKPIRNMEDFKGTKIRAYGRYPTEMFKLLGGSPLSLAMPDVYDAASKGVIDAMGTPWAPISTFRLYEVYKYWTNVGTDVSLFSVVMNKDVWNSLPKDIQDSIMSVSGMYGAEFAGDSGWGEEVTSETLALIEKSGYKMGKVELDAGELDRWKQIAGKPLWNLWLSEMQAKNLPGQKIMDALLKLQDKYKLQ